MMGGALRRRLSGAQGDEGISLVELLVTMIVFGVLSAVVINLYISATRSVNATSSSSQNTQAAGNIMNELSRVIRSATDNPVTGGGSNPAISNGTSRSLSLYSYVDANAITTLPSYVQFTVDATTGQIHEQRWPAKVSSTGLFTFDTSKAPSFSRILPGRIATSSTLFSYLGANGTPMVVATSGLTAAQQNATTSITVNVVVQVSNDPSALPATLQNSVGMPNHVVESVGS
jgi:type II secretory pathway pseudopilin PulG